MDSLLVFAPRALSTNTLIVLFLIQCHFQIRKSACPSLPRTFSILALEIPGPRNPSVPRQLGAAGHPAASERSVRPADCFWEMMTHLFWHETYLWHQALTLGSIPFLSLTTWMRLWTRASTSQRLRSLYIKANSNSNCLPGCWNYMESWPWNGKPNTDSHYHWWMLMVWGCWSWLLIRNSGPSGLSSESCLPISSLAAWLCPLRFSI